MINCVLSASFLINEDIEGASEEREHKNLYKIRLYGRGGQLFKKSSQVLASAFMAEKRFVQLCPNPLTRRDRVGLPCSMSLKIDGKEFMSGCRVFEPDCVVIFDDKISRDVRVYEGMRNGVVVINSDDTGSFSNVDVEVSRVGCVDADDIAARVYGSEIFPRVGPAMLGAFAKGFGNLRLSSIKDALEAYFPVEKKRHIEALETAYKETCVMKIDESK